MIVENVINLPQNIRRTHLLPDRETANVLVDSFFTNVSHQTFLSLIMCINSHRPMVSLKSSIASPF